LLVFLWSSFSLTSCIGVPVPTPDPIGIFLHTAWLHDSNKTQHYTNETLYGFRAFLESLSDKNKMGGEEIWVLTPSQVIAWMQVGDTNWSRIV
jgi:hypothetical protein